MSTPEARDDDDRPATDGPPAQDDPPAGAPTDEPAKDDAEPTATPTDEPAQDAAEPTATPTDEPARVPTRTSVTGQHAAPRPYPPSAPQADPPAGATAPLASPAPGERTAPGQPPAPSGPPAPGEPPALSEPTAPGEPTAATTPAPVAVPTERPDGADHEPVGAQDADRESRVRERRAAEPSSGPGIGRHLLAVVVGFVLTPFALLLVGVGITRLADIAGTGAMGTDALGLTLLVLGVALLVAVVLLGAWSAALPVTGGLVWGIGLGVAYLAVPDVMEDGARAMTADNSVPPALDQLAEAAMSGHLVVLGSLLVAAGIAATVARRLGRRRAEQSAAVRTEPLDRRSAPEQG